MQNKVAANLITIPIADRMSIPMIAVEGGGFMMGGDRYDDEKPVHVVTLAPFEIGQYPVTQGLWEWVMQENPSFFKGATHPVEQVSWNDIQVFLKKFNALPTINRLNEQQGRRFCLPTEAQWEYAVRGGKHTLGFPYAGSHELKEVGWFWINSHEATKPIGLKLPNELGLYDMSGNVWEWCVDHWHSDYENAPKDGSAWTAGGNDARRVVRGGSWVNDDYNCRVSNRSSGDADNWYHVIGFRLARY
ncbi:MAG: formylglycine-generating enzyme family protein [Saprospiraceae bacterium]